MHRKLLVAAATLLLATGLALGGGTIANAESPLGAHVDGLRYQAEARAYGWRPTGFHAGETAAGIRAEGLRYQAEARVYRLQTAAHGNRTLAYGLIAPGAGLAAVGMFLLFRNRRRTKEASFAVPAGSES